MRKIVLILAFAVSIFSVSGCDFFRMLAGGPTSADIEAKRELIVQEQKSHQQRLDSLKLMQKQIADSLAVVDSIRNSIDAVVSSKPLAEEARAALKFKYYIIVGAFSSKDNADKLQKLIESRGYAATIISYRNGFNAVGVSPSDDLAEVSASLGKLKQESFCPSDAWILENK